MVLLQSLPAAPEPFLPCLKHFALQQLQYQRYRECLCWYMKITGELTALLFLLLKKWEEKAQVCVFTEAMPQTAKALIYSIVGFSGICFSWTREVWRDNKGKRQHVSPWSCFCHCQKIPLPTSNMTEKECRNASETRQFICWNRVGKAGKC